MSENSIAKRSDSPPTSRAKVVIAGASGFVGKQLVQKLAQSYEVVGLSRTKSASHPHIEFRECDLFSLLDAKRGLEGADYAIYLVHSMMPSARLTQGSFQDMDLIVADHFARACAAAGVKQMIYLGGLIPDSMTISEHLKSRLEVETTLASYGVPLTTLRAGLIIGPQGSSFQIMSKLVHRLPIMLCPAWTETLTQPIADQDVVQIISQCIGKSEFYDKIFDIGAPDILSYRKMMELTAAALGKKLHALRIPLLKPTISRLWVTAITGAPKALVKPLIQSLSYSMIARNRNLQEQLKIPGEKFTDAVKRAIVLEKNAAKPKAFTGTQSREVGDVRSVQRLPLPPSRTAEWVAQEYLRWLPGLLPRLLRVDVSSNGRCEFRIRFFKTPLLILQRSAELSTPDRQLIYIVGGLLAQTGGRGRLEFLETRGLHSVLAAVHEYRPSLPWLLYTYTQAMAHAWVMHRFGRHLADDADDADDAQESILKKSSQ